MFQKIYIIIILGYRCIL